MSKEFEMVDFIVKLALNYKSIEEFVEKFGGSEGRVSSAVLHVTYSSDTQKAEEDIDLCCDEIVKSNQSEYERLTKLFRLLEKVRDEELV